MAEISVGEGQNGGRVPAQPGDVVVVSLPENPTTGFRWNGAEASLGPLRLLADEFVPSASSAIGGGGLRVFRYRAEAKGAANLVLRLSRPWESSAPRSEFTIDIAVSE